MNKSPIPLNAATGRRLAAVRCTSTSIERLFCSRLGQLRRRARLHSKDIPGHPDVVFRGSKVAVFLDGCFWHGHRSCFRLPVNNREYWREKIRRNVERREEVRSLLVSPGWAKSKGVGQEIYYAIPLGKQIKSVNDWLQSLTLGSEVRMTDPDTGAQKGQKLARFDLVPVGPLWEVAEHFGRGAAKYAEHNWARGYRWSLCYQAALRHLMQFWAGEDRDEQLQSKHVIAAAWHCLVLAFFMDVFPQKDDRPHTQLGTDGVPPVPH